MKAVIFHNRLHLENDYSWLPADRVILIDDNALSDVSSDYYDYCAECADYLIQYLQEELYEIGLEVTEQWYLYETHILLGRGRNAFIDYISEEVDIWYTKDIVEYIPEEMTDEDKLRAKGVIM